MKKENNVLRRRLFFVLSEIYLNLKSLKESYLEQIEKIEK